MTALYKPIGIVLGLGAASLGRLIFGKLWGMVTDEEPPEPTTQETSWPRLMLAAAIQGIIFRMTRVAVDRWGAIAWHQLTGNWPGETRPDPE